MLFIARGRRAQCPPLSLPFKQCSTYCPEVLHRCKTIQNLKFHVRIFLCEGATTEIGTLLALTSYICQNTIENQPEVYSFESLTSQKEFSYLDSSFLKHNKGMKIKKGVVCQMLGDYQHVETVLYICVVICFKLDFLYMKIHQQDLQSFLQAQSPLPNSILGSKPFLDILCAILN